MIVGTYFDGGSSASRQAEFALIDGRARVRFGPEEAWQDTEIVRISDRLANLPRKITFRDGSTFETLDNDHVDEIAGLQKSFASRLSRSEGSLKYVLAAVVGVFASIYLIFQYGLPAMATAAAKATPSSVVSLIDTSTLATVDATLFSESSLSEERKRELSALFDELVAIAGQTDPPLKLNFRDGGFLGANAIALPGGSIILTDQLEALAENDDQLAGVFAHEIGHVELQHSLKQLYRLLGIGFMASVIGGESGQIAEEMVTQASALQTFSFSREFEAEADRRSVEIMLKAGRNPTAFVDLLDRILDSVGVDDRDTGWLSTHPGNNDRREAVNQLVDELTR